MNEKHDSAIQYMDKGSYRKQAIKRWKQKRLDSILHFHVVGTSNVINLPHFMPVNINNS